MASTSITLHARAVDQTGKVFGGIRKNFSSMLRTLAVGVAAGAGAFGAIVKQLGELSDMSTRAGASADDLTRLSTALGVIGVKSSSVEQVTQAFERMARTTGATGMAGFKSVLVAISKLPTTMERGTAAVKVFGRAGSEYLPLIESIAQNGVQSLNDVIDGMPKISQAAADSGDAMADAWATTWAWMRNAWAETVASICATSQDDLEGGIRGTFARATVYVDEFTQKATIYTMDFFSNFTDHMTQVGDYLKEYFAAIGDVIAGTLSNAWRAQQNHWEMFWEKVGKVLRGEDSFNLGDALPQFFGDAEQKKRLYDGTNQADVLKGARERYEKAYKELLERWKSSSKDAIEAVDRSAAKSIESVTKSAKAVAEIGGVQRAQFSGIEDLAKASTGARRSSSDSNAFLQGGTYAAITQGLRNALRRDSELSELRKGNGILDGIRRSVQDISSAFGNVEVLA